MHISALRPTQFTLGFLAVAHQAKKVNKMAKCVALSEQEGRSTASDSSISLRACSQAKLVKYIGKKTVPVVIGPENKYYMLDRHHAARALWVSSSAPASTLKGVSLPSSAGL